MRLDVQGDDHSLPCAPRRCSFLTANSREEWIAHWLGAAAEPEEFAPRIKTAEMEYEKLDALIILWSTLITN